MRCTGARPAELVGAPLSPNGLPRRSLPGLCYFDPGDISSYFARPAGGFEIVAQEKYSDEEIGRVPASVAGGHAVTLVLTGGGQQPFGVLTFPDF